MNLFGNCEEPPGFEKLIIGLFVALFVICALWKFGEIMGWLWQHVNVTFK